MNAKTFIVHLKRATDRQKQVEQLKEKCPLPVEVIDAVDGMALEQETIDSVYQHSLHKPSYPFKLRTPEVACFLSHRKCWQAIVDQNLDAALILEDDVDLDATVFGAAYELALENLSLDSYIRFPFKPREVAASTVATTSTHRLISPKVIGLGTIGQLVGRNAAKTLLSNTLTFDRPVDVFLQMTWVTGVSPLSVCPPGISEVSAQLSGSCIGKRKSWGETLHREIFRPWYRRQLSARAAKHSSATR